MFRVLSLIQSDWLIYSFDIFIHLPYLSIHSSASNTEKYYSTCPNGLTTLEKIVFILKRFDIVGEFF